MDEYQHLVFQQLGLRLDAKATSSLDQELEHLRAQTYDVKYPELKARGLIPLDTSVSPAAESVAYYQWDEIGMADIISSFADDLPRVDALKEKFTAPVHSLGDEYDYSVQDLRRSAEAGTQLEARRAKAARRGIERRIDEIGAFGNSPAKLKGFLNHPNVTILTAANDGTSTRWVGGRTLPKSPDLIKADMHAAIRNIWVTTKQSHSADTVVLPTNEYSHISQTQVGTENQMTILRSFLENNPMISNVDFWHKLDLADSAGTGPRMVTYQRDPEVLQFVIPQDFEQFPPQARNLAFVVPCHARCGGVEVHYPLAIIYTDGL